jgi:HlyD family secretion protein
MPKPFKFIIPLVIIAAAVAYWRLGLHRNDDPDRIKLSGNIEVTQVDLSFKIAGRLIQREVDEGQFVTAGQKVAYLDDTDFGLRAAQAQAQVDLVQAALSELEAGSRPEEIAQANAALAQARAAARAARTRLELANQDLERNRALYESKVISQRAYDETVTAQRTLQDAVFETEAQVARAQANMDLVKAGPRRETIEQARARLQVAREGLALAQRQLADTVLEAPFDSVVLSKAAEPGAYLNPGSPVVTVGQLARVYLRAFVGETDLGRIKLGQPAEVRTDSYPGKIYPGRVSYISDSAEFTPKTVQTDEERAKLMYRVKIELANPDGELKPGMPADAWIRTRDAETPSKP